MENPTHETYLADRARREATIAEANRARAEAVRRFILVPLAKMIARMAARARRPGRAKGVVSQLPGRP
jgi:hypothetical protein